MSLLCRLMLPKMMTRDRRSAIVNVASLAGKYSNIQEKSLWHYTTSIQLLRPMLIFSAELSVTNTTIKSISYLWDHPKCQLLWPTTNRQILWRSNLKIALEVFSTISDMIKSPMDTGRIACRVSYTIWYLSVYLIMCFWSIWDLSSWEIGNEPVEDSDCMLTYL